MPGLVGIEIALARDSAPVGWVATPEILVRVVEESAAAAKLARIAPPETRIVPGRRTDERVLRLVPSAPSVASAVRLAGALADALTDRRAALAAPPSTAIERRVGPSARTFRPSPGAGREIELLA
jgi:hypothetical protein